jgi:hypothetical protein
MTLLDLLGTAVDANGRFHSDSLAQRNLKIGDNLSRLLTGSRIWTSRHFDLDTAAERLYCVPSRPHTRWVSRGALYVRYAKDPCGRGLFRARSCGAGFRTTTSAEFDRMPKKKSVRVSGTVQTNRRGPNRFPSEAEYDRYVRLAVKSGLKIKNVRVREIEIEIGDEDGEEENITDLLK